MRSKPSSANGNEQVDGYRKRSLAAAELLAVSEHIGACEVCRGRVSTPEERAGAVSAIQSTLQARRLERTTSLTEGSKATWTELWGRGGSDADALRSARDTFRDTAFAWPTWTWARLQARTGKGKVYVYYFSHRPPYPDTPQFKDWGAAHAGEISFVFGNFPDAIASTTHGHLSDIPTNRQLGRASAVVLNAQEHSPK